MRRRAGFTLIEIIVALAVLALAMGGIISSMARYAANTAYLRDKTIGLWIAHNRLTEIELDTAFPAEGKSDGDAEMAGGKWRWYETVTSTPDENIHRVEVGVRREGEKDNVVSLTAFIAHK